MARSYAYTAMNRYAPMQKAGGAGGAGGGGAVIPANAILEPITGDPILEPITGAYILEP